MSDSPGPPKTIVPQTIVELQKLVADKQQIIAVGNQTKQPLSDCPGATRISLSSISGITQYEPSEFTFTALAGTTLEEIAQALDEKQQYLPFDPMLIDSGATIGGTVAAGLSGPGRFRYGGIRDFVLGVDFFSGDGKQIRAGGKVVKNAAGFDIPKFLVGSMGRFGVMTELTFKVFPKHPVTQTVRVQCESHAHAIQRMAIAAGTSWELDAVDYRPDEQRIYLRIGGPESSIDPIVGQIRTRWGSEAKTVDHIDEPWAKVRELCWSIHRPIVAKIPTTPAVVEKLSEQLPGQLWFSAAANVLWHSMKNDQEVKKSSDTLSDLNLNGLVVKGESKQCRIGSWPESEIQTQLKDAFDPEYRFPPVT